MVAPRAGFHVGGARPGRLCNRAFGLGKTPCSGQSPAFQHLAFRRIRHVRGFACGGSRMRYPADRRIRRGSCPCMHDVLRGICNRGVIVLRRTRAPFLQALGCQGKLHQSTRLRVGEGPCFLRCRFARYRGIGFGMQSEESWCDRRSAGFRWGGQADRANIFEARAPEGYCAAVCVLARGPLFQVDAQASSAAAGKDLECF